MAYGQLGICGAVPTQLARVTNYAIVWMRDLGILAQGQHQAMMAIDPHINEPPTHPLMHPPDHSVIHPKYSNMNI